jgi:outer membrane usher protein
MPEGGSDATPSLVSSPALPLSTHRDGMDSTLERLATSQRMSAPQVGSSHTSPQVLLLAIRLNGASVSPGTQVLETPAGTFLFAKADLQAWRLRAGSMGSGTGGAEPFMQGGVAYVAIPPRDLISIRLDRATQTLGLQVLPQAFDATRIEVYANPASDSVRPSPGGFFNYDLSTQRAPGARQAGGIFQLGGFNRDGVGIIDVLAQRASGTASTFPAPPDVVRLDSTWTSDFPARLASLRFGDIISQPGAWGQAARLGGMQYGTNFGTQPGFITTPLQAVSGLAALPSVVDVYVNQVLTSQSHVAPGPFSITNLPVVTGSGQITTVVTDLLGRQQVITQPFYAGTNLLRQGLSNFSFEAGALRQDYGLRSNDYGPGAAIGTYSLGLTNSLTGEVHGELQKNREALGLSAAWIADPLGIVSASLAASHNPDFGEQSAGSAIPSPRQGTLLSLGLQRLTPTVSVSAHAQWATAGFTQLGAVPGTPGVQRESDITISQNFGRAGSVAASYVAQATFGSPAARIAQLSYSVGVGAWGFVSATLLRTVQPNPNTQVSLIWTMPLGPSTSASLSAQSSSGGSSAGPWTASIQHNLPVGPGWGYQVQAGGGPAGGQPANLQAQGQYQGPVGLYTAQVQRLDGQDNYRLEAQGGVGTLGGATFLSRAITDSFALVQVPGLSNVRVYANNQEVGRTNAAGDLLIPSLLAYQRNVVSVNQADIPLDADVGKLSLPVVPAYRSGILARFPIHITRSAIFNMVQADGKPVPAGAQAQISGGATSSTQQYPVGMDGRGYLSGLGLRQTVLVQWPGGQCSFVLLDPPSSDPLPDLGTHTCQRINP